jgi:hypothetical protein
MIGQCLSNKNKNATVSKSKKISDLNKASLFVFSKTLSPMPQNKLLSPKKNGILSF